MCAVLISCLFVEVVQKDHVPKIYNLQISYVSPSFLNIAVHTVLTVHHTCSITVMTRRICLTVKSYKFVINCFFILTTLTFDSGVILWREIRCLSLSSYYGSMAVLI